MSQDLPPCTVETCDRPTQERLCSECVTELQDAYDQIEPLLPVLESISRNEDVAFGQPTAGGRGGATGSRPPMDLSAYQLHLNLGQALVYTPAEYAQHDDGAWSKWMIEDQVRRAKIMVHGEKEERPTPDYINYRLSTLEPMYGNELVEWFKDQLSIDISLEQIRNWKKRKFIQSTTTQGNPKYHPIAVYVTYSSRRGAAHA